MKKVLIIGCPGSGKSTFAKKLHQQTGLPLYHLDNLYWNADGTRVERPLFLERLDQALQNEQWIIDGNFFSTMDLRLAHCDTALFLDYPTEVCLQGVYQRLGTPRSDIPWVDTEPDEEFIAFIRNFSADLRPQILALLEKHSQKEVHTFRTRAEADAFLERLKNSLHS